MIYAVNQEHIVDCVSAVIASSVSELLAMVVQRSGLVMRRMKMKKIGP